MKAKQHSTARLRSFIRWTTGIALTTAIIGGSCLLFPALIGDLGALVLTSSLAVIVGLQVALPPLDPEDDWVRIGQRPERERPSVIMMSSVREDPQRDEKKLASGDKPVRMPAQPVFRNRLSDLPSWALNMEEAIHRHREAAGLVKPVRHKTVAGTHKLLPRN